MTIQTTDPSQAQVETPGPLGDGGLTLMEFVTRDPLPLSVIQDAVFEFLEHRDDAVVYGAQAVNVYVARRRNTEDVDVATTRGIEFAEELRYYLAQRFHIAVRIRTVRGGIGYRIYQVRREGNRHLVDVRPVTSLPSWQLAGNVRVVTPEEAIAGKLLAFVGRRGKPQSFVDRRDLAELLLAFPELKNETGPVRERLDAAGASREALEAWSEIVREEIVPSDEDAEF